jgi:hypothetical protein
MNRVRLDRMGVSMKNGTCVFAATCGAVAFVMATAVSAAGAPAVGDAYTYHLVNGYSKELRAQLRFQVSRVEGDRVTFTVTPDKADGGQERTEIYTKEGNWLRAPLENHGLAVEHEFATAYPALVFPLDPGKTWSLRVSASAADAPQARRSVRVDGTVLGTERIRVPAGEFDAIKVRRLVYPGDATYFISETRIVETDWYAPALGRVVRTERKSEWHDGSRCDERSSCDYYGDWSVFELAEVRPARS